MKSLLKSLKDKDYQIITHRKYLLDEFIKLVPANKLSAGSVWRPLKTIRLAHNKGMSSVGLHYQMFNPLVYWLAKYFKVRITLFTVNSQYFYKYLRLFRYDVDI